jgi:phosphonate transport system substrate-binding protein
MQSGQGLAAQAAARISTRVADRRAFGRAIAAAALAGLLGALAMPAQAQAPQPVLRVTAIPDESPTELARKFAPLGRYLEKRLGVTVEWTPVSDYAAAVEALVNGKVDLAWLGGFTFVQANLRSHGGVRALVQRAEDEKFRSVFITGAGSGIEKLQDLKGRTFSFGSPSSTSGHLMPRSALLDARIDPDRDFRRVSYSGAHDATIAAVAGGKVDAGAVNISVWERFVTEGKVDGSQVHVFFTTEPFHDYNWTVRPGLPEPLRERLQRAFLDLNSDTPEGKEILGLQRASRFVPTQADNYHAIEVAARSAGLL